MSGTSSEHVDQQHVDHGAVHVHVASAPFYWGIFAALCVCTVLTVAVSYFDFGPANIVIAILIATLKASLVASFFMHLRHDKLFNTISLVGAFLFLGIFILLSYDDIAKRGRLDNSYGGQFDLRTGQSAPGSAPATSSTQDSREHEGPEAHEAAGQPAKKE
jgi:cytochrome c oxidase subunit 4